MSIWDRLGNVINSYLNDFEKETSGRFRSSNNYRHSDPDLDAAYDELNDFLDDKEPRTEKKHQYSWQDQTATKKLPPQELRADFELLGVAFGANEETCKIAYKKLLKIHHPDRHAGHEGNYKKATEKSTKINAAWDRIEKWRRTKNTEKI